MYIYPAGTGHRRPATGLWFTDADAVAKKWDVLEENLVMASGRAHKTNPQLFTNHTDNKSSPVTFVGGESCCHFLNSILSLYIYPKDC